MRICTRRGEDVVSGDRMGRDAVEIRAGPAVATGAAPARLIPKRASVLAAIGYCEVQVGQCIAYNNNQLRVPHIVV